MPSFNVIPGIGTGGGFMSHTAKGHHELVKKLEKLGEVAKGEILITAARSAANHPLNHMKENVAVLTGNLRRSLHQEDDETGDGKASVKIGTDVEYGPPVEFGTIHMAAQPFIRPAMEATKTDAQNEVVTVVKQLIQQAIS